MSREKAYRIMDQALAAGSPTSEQWFWGGLMALSEEGSWNDERTAGTKKAEERFIKSLAGEKPPREAHLFLYLLNAKTKEGSEHLQKWLDGSEDGKAAENLVEEYR